MDLFGNFLNLDIMWIYYKGLLVKLTTENLAHLDSMKEWKEH